MASSRAGTLRRGSTDAGKPSASPWTKARVVPMLRAMFATSWLWVSRVRTLSLRSSGKTCVLSWRRRTGVENRMRS